MGRGSRRLAPALSLKAIIPGVRYFPVRLALTLLLTLLCSASAWAQSSALATRSRAASQAMNDGRFDEAARIYRELLQTLPNDAGLLMNLGMALAMGGDEAEALAPLQRAVTLKADLVPAH